MTRISKFKIRDSVFTTIFDLFFEVVGKNYSRAEFKRLIKDLFSPVERVMIAKRIGIIYLLLKGVDQRSISNTLKVSTATVSRYNIITDQNDGVRKIFQSVLRNRKKALILKEMFNALFPSGYYGVNWSSAKRREFEVAREKSEGL